ncbi:hypothetical protein EVB68_025 [Rhizobium phage RHph_Y2_6]|uniref:Uncharacterized protein n=1 Tax=Rhizobium phage RHph_Y2_6 TaxID=2509576 RepID=A0A7S5QZ95_9CAUD|nr:hypothetical protein PP748_gp025 [Rhizobium phage RHph_Y2_6]QIG68762.1 hypothetical protein EVB68_025 [Rhizobium phage RHph_Y2_6]
MDAKVADTHNMTFVFGSNEAGIHGAGAARYAEQCKGARYKHGVGKVGQSYAIPTKNRLIIPLTIPEIKAYVDGFLDYATRHSEEQFQVTRIGCGLAGFDDSEIAPMFTMAPTNCFFDTVWAPYLGPNKQFWGSF